MPRFDSEPTPNPNSLKITTDAGPFIDSGMESFASPEQAAGNALGRALFEIAGITNVFILPQFLTVTKTADARWKTVLPEVTRVLEQHFAQRS